MANEHHDYIESDAVEYGDAPIQAVGEPRNEIGPGWHRETFLSFWGGPHLELFVLQDSGASENWKWTARGWRTPDEGDGAVDGWVEASSRYRAEASAIQWYMQKDE